MSKQILESPADEVSEIDCVSPGDGWIRSFQPAFLDTETAIIYPSCYVNGQPAPFHLLDGLPDGLALTWGATGRVTAVKPSVIAGFVHNERFYRREEAAGFLGR